jgi:hypothetical protein
MEEEEEYILSSSCDELKHVTELKPQISGKKCVLLFTDASVKMQDLHASGFVHVTCNSITIPPRDPFDVIDPALPWVGHIIQHNLSVNKPWPAELVNGVLQQFCMIPEQISSVLIVAGLKDERLRNMYRNKSSEDNAVEACNLVDYFLREVKEQFSNAQIVWLGLGKVKANATTYRHIETVVEQAEKRVWPIGIKFRNIFHKVDNSDIKNHYGQLSVSGNRKVMTILKDVLINC